MTLHYKDYFCTDRLGPHTEAGAGFRSGLRYAVHSGPVQEFECGMWNTLGVPESELTHGLRKR
jgi:hypothetical protein